MKERLAHNYFYNKPSVRVGYKVTNKEETVKRVILLIVLSFCLGEVACDYQSYAAQEASPKFKAAAEESYIYGLGIVAMYRYYSGMALQEDGLNKIIFRRSYLKPGDKPGSGPSVDGFYSYGWFDLTDEPIVVSLPAFGDRYYVYQLTDIYGHNFHNVGNSLVGEHPSAYDGPYSFVITPPGWSGEIPEGLDEVKSTGKLVNVLYRIRVSDEAKEAKEVHQLQDQTQALPLSAWKKGERNSLQIKPKTPLAAMEDVLKFGADVTGKDQRHPEFFEQLSNVLQYDPPTAKADQEFIKSTLTKIGFTKEGAFDMAALGKEQQAAILDAQEAGYKIVQEFIPVRGEKVGNVMYTSAKAGNYGDDWKLRAAMIVAGAMYPTMEVSRYADMFTDAEGEPLTGDKTYTITFRKDQLPPVTTFWSLSMYGLGTYDIVPNPINRYMIEPKTSGIKFGEDGSLTITLSHEKPSDPMSVANWLPAPKGGFYAMVRFYAPTEPVLDLTYALPPLTRAGN